MITATEGGYSITLNIGVNEHNLGTVPKSRVFEFADIMLDVVSDLSQMSGENFEDEIIAYGLVEDFPLVIEELRAELHDSQVDVENLAARVEELEEYVEDLKVEKEDLQAEIDDLTREPF